jgi:hypothetical protein
MHHLLASYLSPLLAFIAAVVAIAWLELASVTQRTENHYPCLDWRSA